MHLACRLSLLFASIVLARNGTWTAPSRFLRDKRQAGIAEGPGGGLPQGLSPSSTSIITTTIDGSKTVVGVPVTSANTSVIHGKPPPSVTTAFGTFDLASILPNVTSTLYPEISSLFSCNDVAQYYYSSGPWSYASSSTIPVFGGGRGIETIYYGNAYTVTGCDGVPRVSYSGGTPGNATYTISLFTIPSTFIWTYDFTAAPPCVLDGQKYTSFCPLYSTITQQMKGVWSSAFFSGTSYTDIMTQNGDTDLCGTPYTLPAVNPTCSFAIAEAELLFWPDVRYDNLTNIQCGSNAIPNTLGVTQAPGGLSATQVFDGYTLTYPSLYVKYHGLQYTYSSSDYTTSWTQNETIYPFAPDSVSTICSDKTLPLNYRDLYSPIPWTAWSCAKNCPSLIPGSPKPPSVFWQGLSVTPPNGECYSIDTFSYTYDPFLAWPNQFMSVLYSLNTVDPQSCVYGFDPRGVFDPPHTLSAVSWLTAPNPAPAPATTHPAAPTLDPPTPSQSLAGPATATAHPTSTYHASSHPLPAPSSKDPGQSAPAADPSTSGLGGLIISLVNQPPVGAPAAPVTPPATAPAPAAPSFPAPTILAPLPAAPAPSKQPAADPASPAQPVPGVVVGGNTVPLGSSATLAGGQIVTAVPNGVVIGGSTIAIPAAGTTQLALPDGASVPLAAAPAAPAAISIGGSVIPIGGVATLAEGQIVTAVPGGIAVDGATVSIPPGEAGHVPLPGGAVVSASAVPVGAAAAAPPALSIGGKIVPIGATATLPSGQVVTAVSGGVVVGGFTVPVAAGATAIALPGSTSPIAVSTSALPGSVVVGGVVIPLNGAVTLSDGQTVTYSAAGVSVGGIMYAVPSSGASSVSIGGLSLSAGPAVAMPGSLDIGGVHVGYGTTVDIQGHTVSYGPNGISVDGKSYPIPIGEGTSSISLPGGGSLSVQAVPIAGLNMPAEVDIGGLEIPMGKVRILPGGEAVSYGSAGIVIGGRTYAAPVGTSTEVLTAPDGKVYTVTGEDVAVPTGGMMGDVIGMVAAAGMKDASSTTRSSSSSSSSIQSDAGPSVPPVGPAPSPTGAANQQVVSVSGVLVAVAVALVVL